AGDALDGKSAKVDRALTRNLGRVHAAELVPMSMADVKAKETLGRIAREQVPGDAAVGALLQGADLRIDLQAPLAGQRNRKRAARAVEAAMAEAAAQNVPLGVEAVDRGLEQPRQRLEDGPHRLDVGAARDLHREEYATHGAGQHGRAQKPC